MLVFDRGKATADWIWLSVIVLATVAASVWYFVDGAGEVVRPGGSSLPGFVFGLLGGAIILFEFLLWPRKKVRVLRLGRVQAWLRAHVWLGLLCVPLLILHSGFRLGGTLSTVLMVLLLVVVFSGIWGLVFQGLLPGRMLEELPGETIYSQIERQAEEMLREARQLVRLTCGPDPKELRESRAEPAEGAVPSRRLPGPARQAAPVLAAGVLTAPVAGAGPLRDFFAGTVAPFLRQGGAGASPLRSAGRAEALFLDLKARLPREAHETADTLERFCNRRRLWDRQARLHFWLHNWLWVHFPLSVALLLLMFLHVYAALKYW